MEINKLNEKAIQSAKPGTKDYAKSDGAGLCLWVTTAGGKLWRWGYDFQGKEKLMSYGKYPDVGLARAREFHAAACSLLTAGTDPMADRKAEKNENNAANKNSFQTVAMAWLAHWRDDKKQAPRRHRRKANEIRHLAGTGCTSLR